jgi:uncharacterized protein YhaN
VRFQRIRVLRFGPLAGRDLALDADAVLVFGRNESGKSSFRAALETVLYGFEPASRDAHPLHAWDGGASGDLHLEAELRLDSGELLHVERVLQAAGKLRTASSGEPFSGPRHGNRPLPLTSGLPREVYQHVYSLELADLAGLVERVQTHVDDLLLPESPGLELRPVSELRRELAEEHQRLWRPDRRGRPAARDLRARLAEARTRAADAARIEAELRDARVEQERLEERVAELEERRRALEREREQLPILRELSDLAARRRRLGAPVDLAPLGELPLADPSRLRAEIAELEQGREGPAARLEAPPETLAERERLVLARAAEVEAHLARGPREEADAERAAMLREQAAALRETERRELERALSRAPREGELAAARTLPLESLRALQAGWARAFEAHATAPRPARVPSWALALGAAGTGTLCAGILLDVRAVASAGALLLLAGLGGALWRALRPAAPPPAPAAPAGLEELLRALPLAPALLASPAELLRLLDALERAQRAAGEARVAEETAARLAAEGERRAAEWAELCGSLVLERAGGSAARAARLREALAAARESARRVERDEAERREARRALEATAPVLEARREHLSRLARVLETSEPGPGDLSAKYARVLARRKEQDFVGQREAELRRDPRAVALRGDPRLDVGRDAEAFRPDVLDPLSRELETCDAELGEARDRLGRLRERLSADPGSQRACAADRVLELERALGAACRERDRLALLERILVRAEARYRDAHQPDVLRRAGAYLRRVTEGRYERLDYESADRSLWVREAGRAEPLRVAHPLSRGTLDQIFLCLRLGLLDHLDEDRETLPLVLDDALLRMDDFRRPEVYRLLTEVARRRQVFLLTCQGNIAAEAESALKLHRIQLGA